MISFDIEEYEISDELVELAKVSINKALDYTEFPYEVDVALTTVSNETIREINKEHRGLDKATDVLSFPMVDWVKPCDYDFLDEHVDYYVNPDSECILLGDIVLSMDKVKSQATQYGHSLEREFAFLIVHSMLHLLGYDHMVMDEEKVMIDLQKKIMSTIDYRTLKEER